MLNRLFGPLALALLLVACQATTDRATPVAELPELNAPLLIAVVDSRPYVLAGEESERFTGTRRGKWGQREAVETASGEPLATELAGEARALLAAEGIEAAVLPARRGTPIEALLAAFRATPAERLLVISVEEWRSDSYTRVTARWALEATVFDRSGTFLGRRRIAGAEALGETPFDGRTDIGARALREKFRRLLRDPAVAGALV